MFYSSELLARKKGSAMSVIWLAATLGNKKLTKKEYGIVNVPEACEFVAAPPEPLALRLSSNLMVGITRIYKHQYQNYYNDVNQTFNKLRFYLYDVNTVDTTIAAPDTKTDAITMQEQTQNDKLPTLSQEDTQKLIEFGWLNDENDVMLSIQLSQHEPNTVEGLTLEIPRHDRFALESIGGSTAGVPSIKELTSHAGLSDEILKTERTTDFGSFQDMFGDLLPATTTNGSSSFQGDNGLQPMDMNPFEGTDGVDFRPPSPQFQKPPTPHEPQAKKKRQRKRKAMELLIDDVIEYSSARDFTYRPEEIRQLAEQQQHETDSINLADLMSELGFSPEKPRSRGSTKGGSKSGDSSFQQQFDHNPFDNNYTDYPQSVLQTNDFEVELARHATPGRRLSSVVPWANFVQSSKKSSAWSESDIGMPAAPSTRTSAHSAGIVSEDEDPFKQEEIEQFTSSEGELKGEIMDFLGYVKAIGTDVDFTQIATEATSRSVAAEAFYNLLVLASNKLVKLSQHQQHIRVLVQ